MSLSTTTHDFRTPLPWRPPTSARPFGPARARLRHPPPDVPQQLPVMVQPHPAFPRELLSTPKRGGSLGFVNAMLGQYFPAQSLSQCKP